MSVFAKISIPMFCIAFAMFYLARNKRDKITSFRALFC